MKIQNKKTEILVQIKNIFLIIAGTLVLSFGTSVFILPFDLVTGGVSGISIVVNKLIPFEFITMDLIITSVTWILFLLGWIFLGRSFAAKTFISTVVYPVGVFLFTKLASPDFLNGFFYLRSYPNTDVALILATLMGGAMVGAGCAITFVGGGSTGGVDVLSFIICKIFKRAKSSVVFFVIDSTIILCGMFVIGSFVLSLLGIISAFVSALMIEKVFIGSSKSFIAQIITDKYEIINREIIEKVDRGTTVIDITGGYSGQAKKMIMVSFTVNQYAEILNVIHRNDGSAFVTIHQAHEISGEGWTR